MSSDSEFVIQAHHLGKCYQIYSAPKDRLKQMVLPFLQRYFSPILKWIIPNFKMKEQYYSPFWALKNISFELKRKQTVGVIGRNGSGKSTLLQLICGTLTPTTGEAKVNGRVAALLELGSGFNPEFTGRENVYLNAALLGLSKQEIDERYQKILDFAEIGAFINQPVKTYSSGMFVRLAFAVIANVDADVLIIDEALAVGDVFFQQKCMRFLQNFKKKGTILFVSHDTHSVSNLCDYAIWLEEGEMKAMGDARNICEQYWGLQYQSHSHLQTEGSQDSAVVQMTQHQSDSFGTGVAEITEVKLLDKNERNLTFIQGGEEVILIIRAKANQEFENPIIGFAVKDRLGQLLFGDNTYHVCPSLKVQESGLLEAKFCFKVPHLKSGQYIVAPAIASGTLESHVQHHWIHEALAFTVHSRSLKEILINIPMDSVSMVLT